MAENNEKNTSSGADSESAITKKDITKMWIKWHAFSETALSFERLQALPFCYSLTHILKKLYTNKEDLKNALKRHLVMFNTQANWGSMINGITAALEENASKTEDKETREMSTELVTGIKTGLMGPIAGIGDSLDFGTFRPIVIGICLPFVVNGSWIASLIPLAYQVLYMAFMTSKLSHFGYRKGKESIVDVLKSGAIHRVIDTAGMFGLFMMGALSSTYVQLTTPLVIQNEGSKDLVIQDILNGIAPNLLACLFVFGVYFYLSKKGPHYLRILFLILALSLLGSFLGVL